MAALSDGLKTDQTYGLKSNFPGKSTDHRSGIGFLIVDGDLE